MAAAAAAAKSRNINGRKKTGIINLKIVVDKLHRSLSLARSSHSYYNNDPADVSVVPPDVKEGHFAVIAIGDHRQPKRYVVAISYLNHLAFQRLLEQAAKEYGFDHEVALTVPCHSNELDSILMR